MHTFELTVTADWQEVLQGNANLAFDLRGVRPVFVYFTDGEIPDPDALGSQVQSWPEDWDFEAVGMPEGQAIWVRTESGANDIRGVR